MYETVDPWVQAGLERMERQAPNRYWKVMGAVEQERRAAQLERQLAQAEALKVETWKRERAEWKQAKKEERIKQIEENNAEWLKQQKRGGPLVSDKEGGLLVLGAAACCALAAPLTAAGVAFGLLCFFGHYSD